MNPFADIYSRADIACHYLTSVLQPAEALLLQAITARAGEVSVLDLGVGAGRTSFFLLPFARTYLGLDISPRMIDLCRERFRDFASGADFAFQIGDASVLDTCADGFFDVVLFSCNGIDCLAPDRRAACLSEVFRVLRSGGVYLFSTHNLQAIEACFGAAASSALEPLRLAGIRRNNEPFETYAGKDAALFWDGVYGDDGALRHLYVRPRAQRRVLEQHGFSNLRVISSETGSDLGEEQLDRSIELALHFWCEKPAHPASHLP